MLLTIQKKRMGADVCVLELEGRITLGNECQELEWQVEDLLKNQEKKIILDLSKVKYLDSTGVGMLVMCSGKMKQAGGELSIAGAQGIVEQTLRMTRVDQIVTLHATSEAAGANLTTSTPLGEAPVSAGSTAADSVRLRTETRRVGDLVIVTCGGRLVADPQLESFRDQIKNVLSQSRDVVLDFSKMTFIDSSGLGALVRLLASARSAGGDIKLCNVPPHIRQVLRITNLTSLFDTHESEPEAVSAFYRGATSSTISSASGIRILCVDKSSDVLAYLRELLLRAGYNPLTNNSIHDALTLLNAAGPKLVIFGPNPPSEHPSETWEKFRKAAARVPLVELESDFATRDAGQAGAQLLATVRNLLSSHLKAEAAS
jgi:anti-sigma B factor antagonist